MSDRFVSPPGHEPHKHNYKPPHCWACDISWPCPAVLTATIDAVHAENARLREHAETLEAEKDGAYLERNQVVSALAKCFPSGVARTAIEGWSEDWHGCVYIDLPTGQASWHFHDSQAYLFDGLPPYTQPWDGHDTPEKYRRLAALGNIREQAEALAAALERIAYGVEETYLSCPGVPNCSATHDANCAVGIADAALRAYREASHE